MGSVGVETGGVEDPAVTAADGVLEPDDADVMVALGLGRTEVDGGAVGALACPQPASRRHTAAIVTGR